MAFPQHNSLEKEIKKWCDVYCTGANGYQANQELHLFHVSHLIPLGGVALQHKLVFKGFSEENVHYNL